MFTFGFTLFELLLGVAPAVAQVYEVGSGQCAGSFGRERPLAVEGIVGIDGAPVLMRRHGYASPQMADNEVEVVVAAAHLARIAAGNGALDAVESARAELARSEAALVSGTSP